MDEKTIVQEPAPCHYTGQVKTGKKRIAVYCRVSTLSENQDLSFDTQRDYYRNLVEGKPELSLVGIYADHGISGLSTDRRVEFNKLIDDCMAGKVDEVWTKSISRFARNLGDCVSVVRKLKTKHIPVLFEKEAINTMDPNSEMVLSVLAACAQEESNSMSKNMRWANDHRNSLGIPSIKPAYGYRRVKGDKNNAWEIEPEEAKRVRLVFQMAAQGRCYPDIITALNETEEDTHIPWTSYRIRAMIRHEAYIGDILTNKSYTVDCLDKHGKKNKGEHQQFYIEGHHEPLVDKETYDQAQKMLEAGALRGGTTAEYHDKLVFYVLHPDGVWGKGQKAQKKSQSTQEGGEGQ